MSKIFVEETELKIKETHEDNGKAFNILGNNYITKINQTIHFSSSIFKYHDDFLIYIKKDNEVCNMVYNIYSFDPISQKEIKIYSVSESNDIFINRTGKNGYYIISINIEYKYGSIIFCTLGEDDIYNTTVINFSKLLSVDRMADKLLVNCHEEILEGEIPYRLYNISLYKLDGKIDKVLIDKRIRGTKYYKVKIKEDKMIILLVNGRREKVFKKIKLEGGLKWWTQ